MELSTACIAPALSAACRFPGSMSATTIFAPVRAGATFIAFKPTPPAPMIRRVSSSFSGVTFLIAL